MTRPAYRPGPCAPDASPEDRYRGTPCTPQLGDLALNTYPSSPERPSSPEGSGRPSIDSVWSAVPLRLTSRPESVSRIGSRGVPSPISTSGQYGTQSTYGPSSSVRNRDRLCPPLNLTGDPSKHEETPTRGRSIIDIQHVDEEDDDDPQAAGP